MTAANTGATPAQIIDIFEVVPGTPVATIREPVCWRDVPGGKKSPRVEYYRCTGCTATSCPGAGRGSDDGNAGIRRKK